MGQTDLPQSIVTRVPGEIFSPDFVYNHPQTQSKIWKDGIMEYITLRYTVLISCWYNIIRTARHIESLKAVIGAGMIASRHNPAQKSVYDAEVVAVFNRASAPSDGGAPRYPAGLRRPRSGG